MKKYFVFTVIAVLFTALSAQAQLKWGLKAGVNLSSMSFSNLEENINPSNFTGFQVGPMMEFTVPIIGVGMDAALLYSQTGFKLGGETFKNGSLLVPVNFKYKMSLLGIAGAFATVGPYADFKIHDDLGSFQETLKTKSFGAGLNFGIGAELLSKLQVGVNYQLGLTDNYGSTDAWDMITGGKTRVWSITAAYFF